MWKDLQNLFFVFMETFMKEKSAFMEQYWYNSEKKPKAADFGFQNPDSSGNACFFS